MLETNSPANPNECVVTDRETLTGSLYLYGIISAIQSQSWTVAGIAGNSSIFTVSYEGLSAIVSVAAASFIKPTQEDLLAHNRVLENIMQSNSVLPLRLGTVAQNADDVRTFLKTSRRSLRNALRLIEHKVEFDVEVTWNGSEIFKRVVEQDPEVRMLKENARIAGDRLAPDQQLAAGMVVANAIEEQRAEFASAVELALTPFAERLTSLKSPANETVFHAAFLVSDDRAKDFEAAIYGLGDLHGRILKFRFAGPLPCYSFVDLHLTQIDFQAVDEARRALGLPIETSLVLIKQAFRMLAPQIHPDHNSQDPLAKARFEKVAASYRLLLGLWETLGDDPAQVYSLTPTNIGQTLLVISKEPRLSAPKCSSGKTLALEPETSVPQASRA